MQSGIILLDDDFFGRINDNNYLKTLIDFLIKYFDLDIAFFQSKDTPYLNYRNDLNVIKMNLLRFNKLKLFDLDLSLNEEDINLDNKIFSKDFSSKIYHLLNEYDNIIIPLVKNKHNYDIKKLGSRIHIINHFLREVDSNIAYFISNDLFTCGIITPTVDSYLPNTELCSEYLDVQNELITLGADKINTYSVVAKEVAMRNKYKLDKRLTKLNRIKSDCKREIYCAQNNIFISVDFESGCFEIYNRRGKHKGEISYVNKIISKSDKTGRHDLTM